MNHFLRVVRIFSILGVLPLVSCGDMKSSLEELHGVPTPPSVPVLNSGSYLSPNVSGIYNKKTARGYTVSMEVGTEMNQLSATTGSGYQVIQDISSEDAP